MKHYGKNSITAVLKVIIDLALVVELLVVMATLWEIFQNISPQNDGEKMFLFALSSQFIFGIISFLITLQLRKLISAFNKEAFFDLKNVKRIQSISLLLILYVVFDIVMSQFDPGAHSMGFITQITGDRPSMDAFLNFIFLINYKILFLSAVIYVISRVFKNGYELKEQNALTI